MKLLEIDSNLARIHAKLSPKMNEEDFWFNYYCRIVYLRACSGIDGADVQYSMRKWKETDIIILAPTTGQIVHVNQNLSTASTPPASNSAADTSFDTVNINSPSKLSSISAVSPTMNYEKKGRSVASDLLDDLDLELDENFKDLDLLDELDDIDPDDFEKIGDSELNDELEAQIALELAEDDL